MSKTQCSTCKFWLRQQPLSANDGENPQGNCRRFPPTAVVLMMLQPGNIQSKGQPIPTPTPAGVNPPTNAEQWCGEWRGL